LRSLEGPGDLEVDTLQFGRLVALKNEDDPTNLFRLNQNITPTV